MPLDGLSKEELVARLRQVPPKVVDQVFDLSKRLVDDERGRQARLDAKAGNLMAVVGLALTIAFTFGSQLIKDSQYFPTGRLHLLALVAFVGALVAGLFAALEAHRALTVKGSASGMDEGSVFNKILLAHVTGMEDDKAVAAYKTSLAVHLWLMGMENRRLQEKKAHIIKVGQWTFYGFLVFLLFLFGIVAYSAYQPHADRQAESSGSNSGSSPSSPRADGSAHSNGSDQTAGNSQGRGRQHTAQELASDASADPTAVPRTISAETGASGQPPGKEKVMRKAP